MFRPNATKLDTFRPEWPKYLCFDQFWPREIRFDPRDQNIYVSTNFDRARYVSIRTTTKFYVLTKCDQARYVSTGATKIFMFRPILTKRDTFWTARSKHLGLDQVRLSEICFDRHNHELLWVDQVQPSEILFDRCDQNIYVSTKFDEARYVSTGATKTFLFRPILTQFDRGTYVSTGETKTSEFRASSTKRDMFQ